MKTRDYDESQVSMIAGGGSGKLVSSNNKLVVRGLKASSMAAAPAPLFFAPDKSIRGTERFIAREPLAALRIHSQLQKT